MRLLIDSLVALMLAGVLAAVIYHQRETTQQEHDVSATIDNLRRLQQQVVLEATLERVDLNDLGYPRTIDPVWFMVGVPENLLVPPGRPWLEVVGADQRFSLHPASIVSDADHVAGFWYNPFLGIVRARVPASLADAAAIELYNLVNATEVTSLTDHPEAPSGR